MAHEIYSNEDYIYAVPDGLPWHGLGIQLNRRLKVNEIVEKLPLMGEVPVMRDAYYIGSDGKLQHCDNYRAIVFDSIDTCVGMVKDNYVPVSYVDVFKEVFGWIDELGGWVSGAALLRGGRQAFILAKLPDLDFSIANSDKHDMWLCVFAGSDGKTGIMPHVTTVRVVCMNTVMMALSESKKHGRLLHIRHNSNVYYKLREARDMLGSIVETRAAYTAACEKLLSKSLTQKQRAELVHALIPGDSSRSGNARDKIIYLSDYGKGNREYRGTAYALFQGVTDYVDHEAVQSSKVVSLPERRFLYSTEGAGATLKRKALKLLLDEDLKLAA